MQEFRYELKNVTLNLSLVVENNVTPEQGFELVLQEINKLLKNSDITDNTGIHCKLVNSILQSVIIYPDIYLDENKGVHSFNECTLDFADNYEYEGEWF